MMDTDQVSRPTAAPVQQSERIQIVDILRGFALSGILLVNMTLFRLPVQSLLLPAAASEPWYDQAALWLIHFFGEGKFYALFSLLFGWGLILQMERVEGRGGRFVPLYLRRLLVLLSIGLVHAFLIWMGDILILYAVVGVFLLLFRKARARTLLIWIFILFSVYLLIGIVPTALIELGRLVPGGAAQMDALFSEMEAGYLADIARAQQVYSSGTFAEITRQRVYDYNSTMAQGSIFILGINVLALFLLGVWFAKKKLFQDLQTNRPFFRKLLLWGLLIGLPGNALYAAMIPSLTRAEPTWALALATTAQAVGAPMLMLAYVSILCLLAGSPRWAERLRVLAQVGQMALTNYLLQSILCTLIFYSYGLGLFGKVGAGAGLALTVMIYVLQILFSHWWMRRFRYGPAEWLWRSLTYGKFQPFRRAGRQSSGGMI